MKLSTLACLALLFGCAEASDEYAVVSMSRELDGLTEKTSSDRDAKRLVEIGQVNWLRNLDEAKTLAAKADKPILVLFQEIPGCSTCQKFGREPMSHMLMVEAIESLFVPLLIHNNKKGYDERILQQYNEPAWNNPVVRYVDRNGKDVVARKDRVWTTGGTAERMILALEAVRKTVPNYLLLVAQENATDVARATFAMHCYWEGEVKLGSIPGVRETSAGWIGRKEVVNVTYNPKFVSYDKLLKTARSMQCASTVFAHDEKQYAVAEKLVGRDVVKLPPKGQRRPVKYTEQKYHLRRTALRFLPLTPMQLVKINSVVSAGQEYHWYLSPRQIGLEKRIKAALKQNPKKLHGLVAPDDAAKLVAYARKLEERLGE